MKKTILVPLDGSLESESSLPYARLIAGKTGQRLELLRCFEPPDTTYVLPDLANLASDVLAEHNLSEMMSAYLEKKKAELGDQFGCDTRVERGHPADCILARAESADLVLMSRHGRGGLGRWLLGGVTAKVTRGTSTPVMVVPGTGSEARLDSIMVCLDGSDVAEKGLTAALDLARSVGARLTLYRAVPLVAAGDPEGDLMEARAYLQTLKERCLPTITTTFAQPTALRHHILECCKELEIDLVVIGSHGHGALARWVLGSVAESTLHHAECPVMIVH
jgi:nucleotide-binding universal stress UspA family protein